MHILFNNIFGALDLPMEMLDGFTSSSKAKFIIDLFSMESKKDFVDYKFTFIDKINSLLKSDSEDVEWHEKLNQYIYKSESIIDVLTGVDTDGNYQAEGSEQQIENNKNHDCWIDRKSNFNFFSNSNASDGSYSVLPSLISTLWIGIFILVTMLTISLFLGLYLFVFVDENSKFKNFFLKLIHFYSSMPETLLAIFGFIVVKDVLKVDNHSILLLGLILSLIICPLVVKIVIRSLNMLTDNLKNDLQMTEAKVKLLVNEVLPLIMPYVAYHLVKILAFVTNFGLLFFVLCSVDYSHRVPHGFSSEASSLVSDIFISLTSQTQNHHLISAILFVVMLVNLLFYLIALFLKRFISFKLIK